MGKKLWLLAWEKADDGMFYAFEAFGIMPTIRDMEPGHDILFPSENEGAVRAACSALRKKGLILKCQREYTWNMYTKIRVIKYEKDNQTALPEEDQDKRLGSQG